VLTVACWSGSALANSGWAVDVVDAV